jgi:copper oxidase (laccase) domain-containing protein
VIAAARAGFGEDAEQLLPVRDGKTYFDLWAANALLLRAAGVRSIEISNLCTACHTDDWYSHRAEAGKTGRFGAVMYLNQENKNG